MTIESAAATSELGHGHIPLPQPAPGGRPAILAHRLLAGDQERAGTLAAECEDCCTSPGSR